MCPVDGTVNILKAPSVITVLELYMVTSSFLGRPSTPAEGESPAELA